MDGRSICWSIGDPVFQCLKQVTDVLTINAFADFESTTVDIVANRRESSRASGQGNVNGVIPQRLCYLGWVSVHEVTARGADQKSGDEKQAAARGRYSVNTLLD